MLKNKTSCAAIIAAILSASVTQGASAASNYKMPQVTVTGSQESEGGVIGYKASTSRSSMRNDSLLIDTPQAVSVVTQDQIQDQNITNMEEAVRYVPGITIQQGEGNRDQLTIRGNATTADFFVDGARDDLQYFRDFYNVDRIEFLKGPNAMAFGRGGAGGAINRVTKYADGERKRQLILTGGSFENRRIQADLGDKVNDKLAVRLNSMYEAGSTFRDNGDVERYGINPTATLKLSDETEVRAGYEHFRDVRFNDRGHPSQAGIAAKFNAETFVGNPNGNAAETRGDSVYATINHQLDSQTSIRNHTLHGKYYKFYENVYANSAVDANGNFTLAAYNDLQKREIFTNQFDLNKKFEQFGFKHNATIGAELTRQTTTAFRRNGTFVGGNTVSLSNPVSLNVVNYGNPVIDNSATLNIYALYLQDQIDLSNQLQLVAGLRFDQFNMDFNSFNQEFSQKDDLFSPRLGLVFKPQENLSLYANYSVTYLPSAGDQFNRLNAASANLKPEEMQNHEIGAKWDASDRLSLTAAAYILNRDNTRANDPNNAGFFITTGKTQTRGLELSATGQVTDKWQTIASYAMQDAVIRSTTADANKGAKVALVPRHNIALWNKYSLDEKVALALGAIYQSDQYAGSDNSVRLKGFTRFDAAAFYNINKTYRLQLNIENLLDTRYSLTAHNNNNIQPGSTRAFKVALIANF
jgi:catecholate siderophore receptor